MNEVTLNIGGKDYAVACAPGEEGHVTQLGQSIDAKIRSLGEGVTTSEIQRLLFGALFLADELHETKATAAKDNERHQAEQAAFSEEKRAATLALGKRDQLEMKVAELESELDGLQSAQQRHSAEVDTMRAELQERRDEAQALKDAEAAATSKVTELERERDSLAGQIENKNTLLENANRLIDETNAKFAAATVTAESVGNSGQIDPELAPALERFADLLENCADKLEAQ